MGVAPVRAPVRHATDDDGSKYLAKRDYGRVPAYLVERKMEMAADYEASIRAKEAALIPPGGVCALLGVLEITSCVAQYHDEMVFAVVFI